MNPGPGHATNDEPHLGSGVFYALLLMVLVTPWFYGGVWTRVQWILAEVAAILLAIDLVWQFGRRHLPARIPTLLMPLLLGIGLGILQIVPLSESVAGWVAPYATEMRRVLTEDPDIVAAGDFQDESAGLPPIPAVATRSIYAPSTRTNLALLILATATCSLAARHGSRRKMLWSLCLAVTVCGVTLAFFGLVQKLTSNNMIYWQVPLTQGGSPFGPFVNRNNAGGYLNLCLAGSIGLLILLTRSNFHHGRHSPSGDRRHGTQPRPDPLGESLRQWLAHLNGQQLLVIGGIVCIAGGVLATASRGSILGLLGGAGATAAFFLLRRGNREFGLGMFALIAGGIVLMAWLGFSEEVELRFHELIDADSREHYLERGRWANWQDALQAVPHFPWAGSGLDTYRLVYMPWQETFTGETWFYHAENQFVQSLTDAGLVGLGLLVSAILLVIYAVQGLAKLAGRTETVFAAVGTFALASQLVGGMFDFGLYIPANTLLMATLCGVVTGRAARCSMDRGDRQIGSDRWIVWRVDSIATISLSAILLAGCLFGGVELYRAAGVERALQKMQLVQIRDQRDDRQLVVWLNELNPAVTGRWDDADAHQTLAEIWIQRYRVATFNRISARPENMSDEELWDRASVWQLHGTISAAERQGDQATVDQLRNHPDVRELLQPAWNHARLGRDSCPWLPFLHYTLAELCQAVGDEPNEAMHLSRARRLAPSDATLAYWSGILQLGSGRAEEACESWRQSLHVSRQYESEIMRRAREAMSFETVLETVMPASPATMMELTRRYWPDDEAAQQLMASTVLPQLDQLDGVDSESLYLRATALQILGRTDEALAALQRAVSRQPAQIEWRFEMAQLLYELGRLDEAHDQLGRCVRAAPKSREYRNWLKKVTSERLRQPGAG